MLVLYYLKLTLGQKSISGLLYKCSLKFYRSPEQIKYLLHDAKAAS